MNIVTTNRIVIFTLFLLSGMRTECQVNKERVVRFMFYNTENLFDVYDDSLTDDNEFLPGSDRRWNYSRYNKKINSIAKVILAAGEWEPPAFVGLCEIENRQVIKDLIYSPILAKFDYGIIHQESPDRRGIDVCAIYRRDKIKVLDYKYRKPVDTEKNSFKSRSILFIKAGLFNDTVNIIVNHWPSRRGGVLAGEDTRNDLASLEQRIIDSVLTTSSSKIIVMGDFNCTTDDTQIQKLCNTQNKQTRLFNLSDSLSHTGKGTYKYIGRWELIDQILISQNLLINDRGYYTSASFFSIFSPGYLQKKDPSYPGMMPFATYSGFRYQGGFSDHYPVLADLKFKYPLP